MVFPNPQRPSGLQALVEQLNKVLASDGAASRLKALAERQGGQGTAADAMELARVRQALNHIAIRAKWWQGRL